MPTVMPQSELIRRAVQWVLDETAAYALIKPSCSLLDEAGMRFNLSPADCHMLEDFFLKSSSISTSVDESGENGSPC